MVSVTIDDVTVGEPLQTISAATSRPDPDRLGARYWRLWSASTVSNLADGIIKIGLPLIAVAYTSSPVLVAGVAVTFSLPWLLFALPAGALVDRLDRRRVMLAANTLRATLAGALALAMVFDAGSIWLLYVVAFSAGAAETLYDTSAALFLVGGRFRVERDGRTTLRADIAEGLRFLWRHRLLRTLAVMVGGGNFTTAAVFGVLVLYAVGPGSAIGLTEPGYGLLLTTIAAGIVLGSLVAARIERRLGRARALGVSVVAWAGTVGVPALTNATCIDKPHIQQRGDTDCW